MVATNQKIRRLPGFRFEAQIPSRENVLPRMDVALFVGFASSGPIGIPVVLETAEEFNAIFGKDLPLVWDKEKGETIYAFLAPTVRAFFRNGGNRCWVLRVARVKATPEKYLNRACYNFFPLPGLACIRLEKDEPEDITPVFARARSAGSWSDDLRIGTAVLSSAVKFKRLRETASSSGKKQKVVYLEISANERMKTGELLRLEFADERSILFLAADKIEDGSKAYPSPVGKLSVKITSQRFIWLEDFPVITSPPVIVSPDEGEKVLIRMWTHRNASSSQDISHTFFFERQAMLRVEPQKNEGAENLPPKIKLTFTDLPANEAPLAGTLLITKFQDKDLCLQVEAVNIVDTKNQADVEITCKGVFCTKDMEPDSKPTVERLAFELWIKNDERSFIKLSDLEFNSGSERFWGNLPTDDDLFRFSENKEKDASEIPAWTQTGDAAYFPLAGNGERDDFYFPLFPTAFPETYLGALQLPGTKLQRDGLEEFDVDLFLDEKLKNTGLNNLLNDAEFVRYLSARPRPLWGIHSALVPETTIGVAAESSTANQIYTSLSLEEATIISVPDALHRGWYLETDAEGPILSPAPIFEPPLRPEWWHFQDCRNPDIKPVSEPPPGKFLDCGIRLVKAPEDLTIRETKIVSGKFTLIWKHEKADDESASFVLEESITPSFTISKVIYTGKEKEFKVTGRGTGIYYYRVKAEACFVKKLLDDSPFFAVFSVFSRFPFLIFLFLCKPAKFFSDWSVGLKIKVPALDNWVANASRVEEGSSKPNVYKPDVLFAVQRALLRMCAARGDLFAVLDLPEHYGKDAAVEHIAALKTTKGFASAILGVEPFSADETKALSFGAVYHPWLMTREAGFETMRNIPAGGTICGVMANRAIRRGAWIAPANESLQGVLGLAPAFERDSFLDFQDSFINLVRHEPTGFLVLDSDTLSDDYDLRSINVRRLLSLLRRLALKRGAEYVFEPNDERFRRQVQRGFASLLELMFTRGAFAGTTPATSYQVVVDDSVNNFQSVDQGRFIVELRVAPSLPLKFVTVRLVQTGGRSSVTEVF